MSSGEMRKRQTATATMTSGVKSACKRSQSVMVGPPCQPPNVRPSLSDAVGIIQPVSDRDHVVIGTASVPALAGDVFVHGYTQRDGTYVLPHWPSAPDSGYNDDWRRERQTTT